jgi:hypothetical protein
MAGISVLLLAIMTAVVHAAQTYNKGLTIKEVNLVGREMTDEFKRVIMASNQIDPSADLVAVKKPLSSEILGGRLCTGSVSYVWNYGKAVQDNEPQLTRVDTGRVIRVGKVVDQTKQYCALNGDGTAATVVIPNGDYNALLPEGDRSLDIFGFTMIADPQAQDVTTKQRLYTMTFILGSGNYRAMKDDYSACREPGDPAADLQYCVLQDYSFTVRAGNIGG